MISAVEEDLLKKELVGLFGHMNKMRRELAILQGHDDGNFLTMADTLDAIVENTETASNAIMESMEAIEDMVGELRKVGDPVVTAVCERITERGNQVFEACSFQDLTGQRITRVVNSLKFIEDRVSTMVRMWGKEELEKVVEEVKRENEVEQVDGDRALLHGPQRDSVANKQEDIDKLFSQDDIDKLFG
jgi:chemotaxis protein CheZ